MFNLIILILPPTLAWVIHIFLKAGEVGIKKRAAMFFFYLVIVNGFTFAISYLRGDSEIFCGYQNLSALCPVVSESGSSSGGIKRLSGLAVVADRARLHDVDLYGDVRCGF